MQRRAAGDDEDAQSHSRRYVVRRKQAGRRMMLSYLPLSAANWTVEQLQDFLRAVGAFDTPARAYDRWLDCFLLECDGNDWWRGDLRPAGLFLDRCMDALKEVADGGVYDPAAISTIYPV